ncbi:MAG: DUF4476 domain-containing protein [Bacteroidia bacterium]
MRSLVLIGIAGSLFAQSSTGDVVLISETGEPFRLYLNGEWLSEAPVTRAEAHDVPEGPQRATVYIYPSEGRVIQLRTTFYVERDMIEYYAIRKRKNQYKVVLYNRGPKPSEPLPAPPSNPPTPPTAPPSPQTLPGSGQIQTQNQNNTIIFNPTIQVQTGSGTQVNTSTNPTSPPTPLPALPTGGNTYIGPCNCPMPMSRESFIQALRTLRQEPFEQTRLELAKSIVQRNCLLAQDVRDLVMTLNFENSRLELAEYAYDYTHDLSNYFVVNEAFQFSSSREALAQYIRSKPARQHCQPALAGSTSPSSGSPAPRPCTPCMSAADFAQVMATLNKLNGDLTRLSTAKQISTTNCLSSAQIRDICRSFYSEPIRLEFAKYAYSRVCDPQNYFVVYQALTSTASQQELSQYIQGLSGR